MHGQYDIKQTEEEPGVRADEGGKSGHIKLNKGHGKQHWFLESKLLWLLLLLLTYILGNVYSLDLFELSPQGPTV